MKVPIAYALSFPHRLPRTDSRLNLPMAGPLEFFEPDRGRFPALSLAYEAAEKGGTAPAVLNAANEIAVQAFLEGRLGFAAIVPLLGRVLARHSHREKPSLGEILAADRWAREEAGETIRGMDK
jgi:1-deoxy-D-xylulose-5-phosphate reductoisomerase